MRAMSAAAQPSNVGGARASAVRDAVEALAGQALHPAELLREVERRIAAVVPYDSGAWWTVDPESLLATELGETDQPFCSSTVFSSADFDVFDRLDRSGRDAHGRAGRAARAVAQRRRDLGDGAVRARARSPRVHTDRGELPRPASRATSAPASASTSPRSPGSPATRSFPAC